MMAAQYTDKKRIKWKLSDASGIQHGRHLLRHLPLRKRSPDPAMVDLLWVWEDVRDRFSTGPRSVNAILGNGGWGHCGYFHRVPFLGRDPVAPMVRLGTCWRSASLQGCVDDGPGARPGRGFAERPRMSAWPVAAGRCRCSLGNATLAILPLWRALGDEGADPFFGVACKHVFHHYG